MEGRLGLEELWRWNGGGEGWMRTVEEAFPYLEEICVGEGAVGGEVGLDGG